MTVRGPFGSARVGDRHANGVTRRRFLRFAAAVLPASLVGSVHGAKPQAAVAASDLSFITDTMALMPRASWARRDPEQKRLRILGECNRITIHHQGAAVFKSLDKESVVAQINNVYASHRKLGYGDIGYHFVVDYAGRLWEGRSIGYEGAHVSSSNSHNVAVMVLGNFQEQKASRKQLTSLLSAIDLLQEKFAVKPARIYGHLDLGSTICPGRHMYPVVGIAQSRAKERLKSKKP